ncbi:MAG: aminotransferase class I/II-fold pyridoxal phosphate-dependent enzyme [Pirellulales bacterium]
MASAIPTNTMGASTTREMIRSKLMRWLREEAQTPVEWIEEDQSLTALGVDSLGVAAISCELERETGKRLNPEVLFELENIRQIAEYLDRLPVASRPLEAPSSVEGRSTGLPAADRSEDHSTMGEAAEAPIGPVDPSATGAALIEHYAQLNGRIRQLKQKNAYFFETPISKHDGVWVVAEGRRMLMLGSYEYLGLLDHPKLQAASRAALDTFGTGHHGARLLTGTTDLHKKLEAKLASFMGADDALVFSSGYVTNLSTISTLVDRSCVVIGDAWNHASIVDGCRMSGADFWTFEHNNLDALAQQLARAAGRRTLVVVDAVFSMDGDVIDLPGVVDLCKRHRALLMVDEAHSLGVLGKTGHGIQEHFGLANGDIDVKMGTLSKTFASSGGFVAANDEIITFLRHHARGYIFSGALSNPQVAAALAAVEVLEEEPECVTRLHENRDYYVAGLRRLGFDIGHTTTPIVPIMTKNEAWTLEMTARCRQMGLLVVPVAFPAVPINAPRLRTCISSLHGKRELDFALNILAQAGRATGLIQ